MIAETFPILVKIIPNEYLRNFLLLVFLLLVFRIFLWFSEKLIIKLASKTKTNADDEFVKHSSKPLTWLSFLISLQIVLNEFQVNDTMSEIIPLIVYSLIVLGVVHIFYILFNTIIIPGIKHATKKTNSEVDNTLVNLLQGTVKFALVVFSFLYILSIWGVSIGPFLAGLGIAGLAVALALQPTLGNIFSGIAMILDQTIKIGDIVQLEGGQLGEIYNIGLRTTRIRTFDHEMIILPNSKMADSILKNSLQPDRRVRISLEFGVEYGNDPEYIKKLVIEEINKIDFIDKKEEIRVLFTSMGASSLDFKCMFWVDDIEKKWPAHQEAMSRIYRRLYNENIGIPFPQTTVWLRDEGKVKSPSPNDRKFSKVKNKYYSNFGHEYKKNISGDKDYNLENKEETPKKKSFFKKFSKT